MEIPLTNDPSQRSTDRPRCSLGDDAGLHVDGYPKLSFFFSQCPEFLHLRRFSALAVRALLYRQHQLAILEKELLAAEKRDAGSSDENRKLFSHDFQRLKTVTNGPLDHRPLDEQLLLQKRFR